MGGAPRRVERTVLKKANLRQAWHEHADEFIAWAQKPRHDSYERFHREQFFEIVPPPGRLTLDIGCGEGRVGRDLTARGHLVVGVDITFAMLAHARESSPASAFLNADAASIPIRDGAADVAVAFMSLQDVDDLGATVGELARVLEPGRRLAIAIVHPLNSAGVFTSDEPIAPFVVDGSYLEPSFYADRIERDGMGITFVSAHRPLQTYFNTLTAAGFAIDRVRETEIPDPAIAQPRDRRYQRIPLFLHILATRS